LEIVGMTNSAVADSRGGEGCGAVLWALNWIPIGILMVE